MFRRKMLAKASVSPIQQPRPVERERVAAPPPPATPATLARTLAAATVRQMVPALRQDPARSALSAARARQFAEMTFSPASVAAATPAVYTSLLDALANEASGGAAVDVTFDRRTCID